jgi:hypothetical protein
MSFVDRGESGPPEEMCKCLTGGGKFLRVNSQTIGSAAAGATLQILIGALAD